MSVDRLRRRLRAPSEDRGVLIDPAFADAPDLMSQNQALLGHWSRDFAGQDASRLRRLARQQLLEQATRYTSAYRDTEFAGDATNANTPIVLTGHQPELFHPGVWFKNFVLHELGCRLSAVPVHLLIDNDLCAQTSLRVPTGSVEQPEVSNVALDRMDGREPLPYEERRVQDMECFSSFAERVGNLMRAWGYESLLQRIWPSACRTQGPNDSLGSRIARARHQTESELGLQSLELPLRRRVRRRVVRVFHWRPHRSVFGVAFDLQRGARRVSTGQSDSQPDTSCARSSS